MEIQIQELQSFPAAAVIRPPCARESRDTRPLCVDLFCGLGGWTEGFLAEGYRVVGFDIERRPYPAQLVIQDVLTIHGSQFKDAAVIVASPPCQNYSYLAMPWSRSPDWARPSGDGWEILNSAAAKEMREQWEREGPDNHLFDACFRIQREAIEATRICSNCNGSGRVLTMLGEGAGRGYRCAFCEGGTRQSPITKTRHIPLIVENVRGAIPWVGRSAWNYGSFHLWGDVPALMPINFKRGSKVPGFRFDGSGRSFQTASVDATGAKNTGGSWFNIGSPGQTETNRNPVHDLTGKKGTNGIPGGSAPGTTGKTSWFFGTRADPRDMRLVDGQWVRPDGTPLDRPGGHNAEGSTPDGTKIGGDWFSDPKSTCRKHGSRSAARKMASAQIAKIPFPLAEHIARVYKPCAR